MQQKVVKQEIRGIAKGRGYLPPITKCFVVFLTSVTSLPVLT